MSIKLDNRTTDILYVDKKNNHVSNNKEVIKFVTDGDSDPIDYYITIISGFYKLSIVETYILKYIISNKNDVTYNKVYENVGKVIAKCNHTLYRSINSLRNKGLVYYDGEYLKASNKIDVDLDKLYNAKLVVVELYPKANVINVTL